MDILKTSQAFFLSHRSMSQFPGYTIPQRDNEKESCAGYPAVCCIETLDKSFSFKLYS